MALTRATVGGKITAAIFNALLDYAVDNEPGLKPVIPTSVSGSGVSYSTSTGLVTFTSATAIAIDGVFTSSFRSYLIELDSSGTAATLSCGLRVGGVASVTGYDSTNNIARNATATSSTLLNQTSWALVGFANTLIGGSMKLRRPKLASETIGDSTFGTHANPAVSSAANGLVTNFLTHRPTTAYDGLALTFSAAQSGVVRIYGMN